MPQLLCIDDNEQDLAVRKLFLETSGYTVFNALSGREGLRLLAGNRFEAVLLDYEMPDMNGREIAIEIRRTQPAIPIVMLSGYGGIPEVRDLVTAFIPKGESPAILLAELRKLMPTVRKTELRLRLSA